MIISINRCDSKLRFYSHAVTCSAGSCKLKCDCLVSWLSVVRGYRSVVDVVVWDCCVVPRLSPACNFLTLLYSPECYCIFSFVTDIDLLTKPKVFEGTVTPNGAEYTNHRVALLRLHTYCCAVTVSALLSSVRLGKKILLQALLRLRMLSKAIVSCRNTMRTMESRRTC